MEKNEVDSLAKGSTRRERDMAQKSISRGPRWKLGNCYAHCSALHAPSQHSFMYTFAEMHYPHRASRSSALLSGPRCCEMSPHSDTTETRRSTRAPGRQSSDTSTS